jgi:hypothetical protein
MLSLLEIPLVKSRLFRKVTFQPSFRQCSRIRPCPEPSFGLFTCVKLCRTVAPWSFPIIKSFIDDVQFTEKPKRPQTSLRNVRIIKM